MKLEVKLAYSQLINNRRRTVWTLLGIVFSVAMVTAISGFVASGDAMMIDVAGENYYDRPWFLTTIIGIGAFLSVIIAAVSIVVISNAFRISAGQRVAEFGILKSVGATKRQITATIMYEGLWLCVAGVPIGVILGMVVHLSGVGIANYYLASINKINNGSDIQLNLKFVFKWWATLAAVIFSFLTVLLSAYLPARKAAKVPAIDAIKGYGEVKIKAKHIRANRFIQKVFGFEGALASKSLKRQKRNFRATVISLCAGIILIIVAHSIKTYGTDAIDVRFPDLNVDVAADYWSTVTITEAGGEDGGSIVMSREMYPLSYNTTEQVTGKLREYPGTAVFGAGVDDITYCVTMPAEMVTDKRVEYLLAAYMETGQDEYKFNVSLMCLDKENYMKACEAAGVTYGSNILINRNQTAIDGVKSEFEPFIFKYQTLTLTDRAMLTEPFDLPLHGALSVNNTPNEIMQFVSPNGVVVIVPELDAISYEWLASADDAESFTVYAEDVIKGFIPQSDGLYEVSVVCIADLTRAMRDLRNLLLTFIYGFVGMLILIGLTNVISTIGTNIRSRTREFAVLRSVGMTDGGLNKMLNLESVLSSVRALVFGLPIGIALSYLIYRQMVRSTYFTYVFPWAAVFQCVIGVFVITWVTMRYAASRLKGGSIVEEIRV